MKTTKKKPVKKTKKPVKKSVPSSDYEFQAVGAPIEETSPQEWKPTKKNVFDGKTDITKPSFKDFFDRMKSQKPTNEHIILENGNGMVVKAKHFKEADWSGVHAMTLEANQYCQRDMYFSLDDDGNAYLNDGIQELILSCCSIYDIYIILQYFFEHAEPNHMMKRFFYKG